jgi:hypothetical protein
MTILSPEKRCSSLPFPMPAPDDDVVLAAVPVDDVEGKDKEGDMVVVPLAVVPPNVRVEVIDVGAEEKELELVCGP